MEEVMRKLLILLAVFAIMVVFMAPVTAVARASPITLENDMMLAPAAVMAAPTAIPTASATIDTLMISLNNPLMISGLVVMPRPMAVATAFMKSDQMTWNQAALNVNYSYPGRFICLLGALISDEDTSRIIAMVSEDVVGMNDLMRHGQTNTEYDLAGNTVQNENSIIIQVRSISILPVCFAPVAYCKANEFSFGQERQEQRAAYNYFDMTDTCIAAAIRMQEDNITGANMGMVLRL